MYYIGDRFKFLGAFTAVLFAITMPFTQSSLHSNNIAVAVSNAFGTPKLAVGIAIAVILAAVIFGGAKRIGRVAELVVPVMAVGYIGVALVIIFAHITEVPDAFAAIVKRSLWKGSDDWRSHGQRNDLGNEKSTFSSETGLTTATPSAASAEVSHPAKAGARTDIFNLY